MNSNSAVEDNLITMKNNISCQMGQWITSYILQKSLIFGLIGMLSIVAAVPCVGQAPSPDKFKLPPGFKADMIYNVPREQGSWVSMTTDPKGRLIACDQYGSLYRVTLASEGAATVIEKLSVGVGNAQGLLCAFDSLYVMSSGGNGKDGQPECQPGLYRLQDTNGDDQYDQVTHLRRIVGGGEHGPHAIVLGPDKKSLYVCAGNMTGLPGIDASRQPAIWQEDQVIHRFSDARGHASNVKAPGGWICKTDPEGKSFELIASGFRNEYDFAVDPNGEVFTYDSDMEWDVGLPWYRPTRVCHAVSGAEFGWRNGSGKWPTYYPDSVPPVVDIGPGSPTGVVFGTGAKFPAEYQNSFFISDWSYGIIYSIHMKPEGATYKGTKEVFCTAPALPVTDIVVNGGENGDGAMYFLIGGRRSQSALYRITYQGDQSTDAAAYPSLTDAAKTRMALEQAHGPQSTTSLDTILDSLGSNDRAIRYAARIALEHQPVESWAAKVGMKDTQSRLEVALALARVGGEAYQEQVVGALSELDYNTLSESQKLHLIRTMGLVLCRMGEPKASTLAVVTKLEANFPAKSGFENLELGKLLVAVNSTKATGALVNLLKQPGSQESKIGYALALSSATKGWTQPLREEYFQWFLDFTDARGGNSFDGYLKNIRQFAVTKLTESELKAMEVLLAKRPEQVDPYAELNARPLVKNWTLKDLLPMEDAEFANRDLENGKKMFAVATCYKCHRVQGDGGIVGPDLTAAGRRFNTHDLLETIVDPSKAISDQYEATVFLMADGRSIVGRVVNLSGDQYRVQPDMAQPNNLVGVKVGDIEDMAPSKTSPMPTGLLDRLTRDEILDLLAYMKSTVDVDSAVGQ